ncbi:MAG: RNA polymerase sigma factor [Chitinophagales bacterium]
MMRKILCNKDEDSSHFLPSNSVMISNPNNEKIIQDLKNGIPKTVKGVYAFILNISKAKFKKFKNLERDKGYKDFAQECLLKFVAICKDDTKAAKIGGKDGTRPWKVYVIKILHNLFIDAKNKSHKQNTISLDEMLIDIAEPKSINNEQLLLIWKNIKLLPPECQELLRLHYKKGVTMDSIASADDIKPATIRQRKRRCMSKLKQIFKNSKA